LKNNRISHHLANYIAEIIQSNKKNLRVIDLRWNDLGELGAKQVLSALTFNRNIKFIGLEDNRISMGTLV
jgi:Ran GTPase-activating protein (RanGAP) involved in mRNA processing and transport